MPITVTDPQSDPAPVTAAEARRERLRQARRIRSRRPIWLLLVVAGLLGVVLVGVSAVLAARQDATRTLVEPAGSEADLLVGLTVTGLDPVAGELDLRLVVSAQQEGRVEGGVVAEGFRLFVNDVGGETIQTFPAGRPLRAVEFSVALTGDSAYGYPFDRYEADALVLAADGTEGGTEASLSVEPTAVSTVANYTMSGALEDDCRALGSPCLHLEARRPASTIGYAIWFIALVWALALGGVGVLYVVLRRGVDLPLWSFGYLVGVLFALPPLRASLPTTPPFGGFIDFVAYYWAVAVVGVTLITFVMLWIRENRRPVPR